MLYPLQFEPILKERIWGGHRLLRDYSKPARPDQLIGESWEITDRPQGVSVIKNGPLAGRDLRWLMQYHRDEMLGHGRSVASQTRFPILCKILDAEQRLSLQVHPPASVADELGGEPKTELWFIAQAEPGAELYVGLRRGVTRDMFERKIADGTVMDCFHRLPVQRGDVMFLPSGRVHALGAGLVIFEIQQNSDTTYRVFDWNRLGLDGRPRELHIPQSLASIDFEDIEPGLVQNPWVSSRGIRRKSLLPADPFRVDLVGLPPQSACPMQGGQLRILATVDGVVDVRFPNTSLRLDTGQFLLLPASMPGFLVDSEAPATLLDVSL